MSAYTTLENFIDAVTLDVAIELTNLSDAETTSVDVDVFNRAQEKTSALIDGYISNRYTLPLATVPPLLAGIEVDLLYYELARNGGDEEARKRYDDAIKRLLDIHNGKLSLGLPTATAPAPVGGPACTAPGRILTPPSQNGL